MKNTFFALTMLLSSAVAVAENDLNFNLVNLNATAATEVANDQVTSVIQVMLNGTDPTKLGQQVNQRSNQLLEKIKAYDSVKSQTTGYQTRPMYKDSQIVSWQVSQQIRLHSHDFTQMSELLGDVQDLGTVQSIVFSLSDELIESTQNELMQQAISKFRDKAALIQQQFDEPGYRLVNLSVNTSGYAPVHRMESSMMMSADMSSKSAPAALEAGSNKVSVDVHGQIQLISDTTTLTD
ncbi:MULTISPECIES: SIMPL domain-containing protein [unclassified Methylophaga]|mgnify:FL=1|jgi:predicted secreted protein|uniref:SIMPL domain-containing protein n=1 Tax=unclassified Methylophaga TaxID=2629249 RepID=UPI000C996041|nr:MULTISPECIES: SIMPL domain-containing protein [unclassified Methylophaga]MAK66522.1 SIMPL domain-containing protein [Methylophaga sp.]MAY17215.1 SIMPL domain-containing protein [Methylophaga sp.]HAO26274.1 SIMPL domain-containing protein [Methylophaga sp.]HCD05528.1 SIMPL domain-containing protein [Methylophaga sp.]|tara:strand:+ start:13873 stop:14583 length:711 start_codon:yes stop_codon:yes gene_type:complete